MSKPLVSLLCLWTLALLSAGCMSRSDTDARARAAFIAGQQQALVRAQPQRGPMVTIVGHVRNPVLVWSDDLTVAQAIIDAEYLGLTDPRLIIVRRNGEEYRIEPQALLSGEDYLLEPGDELQIVQ